MGAPEVVVVGAGPAGALAAMILARAGVSVTLLDRAQFPRHKLCGDTVNPGSLALLDKYSLGTAVRGRALEITGMTVTGPRCASVSADYPRGLHGAAITRRDLDPLLVDAAVAAGARFEPGVHVRAPEMDGGGRVAGVRVQRANGDVVRARLVIAADGRASHLGAALGMTAFAARPKRWAFGAYFEGVRGLTPRGEMHIRGDGYLGIAPLPGGIANVCLVRERRGDGPAGTGRSGRTSAWRAGSAGPETLNEAVARDPVLRERFRGAIRVSGVTVLGPLAVDANAAGAPGLLLAGDAAGFVDPMTGDGLRFALRGAELAADAALAELSSGVPAYEKLFRARANEFRSKWRINRGLRALVGSPRALGVAARIARHWTAPVEYLIGIAGDVNLMTSDLRPLTSDPLTSDL